MKITQTLNCQPSRPQPQPSKWGQLINSIVRPPRFRYQEGQLGHLSINVDGYSFSRIDKQVRHQGKKLQVTIFEPIRKNRKLILYLHGNSSSKLEAKNLLPYLPRSYSLACFDFMGCGNNDELDSISLGLREAQQVRSVSNYLRQADYIVYLWGRSMGAGSALKYGKSQIIVADSPFRSMKKLCKEVVVNSKSNPLPWCVVSCLFPCVFWKLRSDVQAKADYDLQDLNIEKAVKQIAPTTTIIFLSGDKDQLIHHHNSQKLYKIFRGKNKYIELVQNGTHNSKRPPDVIKKIMKLIEVHSDNHEIVESSIMMEDIKIEINMKL